MPRDVPDRFFGSAAFRKIGDEGVPGVMPTTCYLRSASDVVPRCLQSHHRTRRVRGPRFAKGENIPGGGWIVPNRFVYHLEYSRMAVRSAEFKGIVRPHPPRSCFRLQSEWPWTNRPAPTAAHESRHLACSHSEPTSTRDKSQATEPPSPLRVVHPSRQASILPNVPLDC